jgi:hypothetical protein
VLEWKEYKHKGQRVRRRSSSKINRLIVTHSLFSLFANPIRSVWALSLLSILLSFAFLVGGIVRFVLGKVSVFMAIISLGLAIIALILFCFGLIAQQGHMIQRELWRLKQELGHGVGRSLPRDRGPAIPEAVGRKAV